MAKSRYTDPATSVDAARLIEGSGKAALDRKALYLMIAEMHPRQMTAPELGVFCGVDRHNASRRLPELRDSGFIDQGDESRRCEIQGTISMTWKKKRDPSEDPQKELFPKGVL